MVIKNKKTIVWTLTGFYIALITILSLVNFSGEIKPPTFNGFDKFVHACFYFGLNFMLQLSLMAYDQSPKVRRMVLFTILAALYGLFIEVVQPFVGREFDLLDIVANTSGAIIGFVVTRLTFAYMKRILSITLSLLALIFTSCINTTSSTTSLFSDEIYTPSHALGFEIKGIDGAKSSLLRITRPWQGDVITDYELLILRNGESAPIGYSGATIEGDAKRIVALSSSNVAMFDRLGVADRIVGVSGIDYISSSIIRSRADQKLTFDVGFDSNLNFELITILKPDIVLLFSVAGANNTITSKLDELKIPYLYIGDYAEESPLGKAEWMVAMGEICGMRDEAIGFFERSVSKYNALCELTQAVDSRPRVMLNTPYRDIWYMPSCNSYMVRLIDDGGGDYIYKENNSQESKPISVEEAYKLATSAQVWLNTGSTINSMSDLRSQVPKFANMPVVKHGDVYNNSARRTPMGGSDFWESGVVYPEMILADIIKILHPQLLDWELYYYNKLQ